MTVDEKIKEINNSYCKEVERYREMLHNEIKRALEEYERNIDKSIKFRDELITKAIKEG